MFALVRENCRYFRVKSGQTAGEVSGELKIPVGEAFCGMIINADKKYRAYTVKAGETYRSIGRREGVDGEELEKVNSSAPLYPTKIIYIPL